MASLGQGIHAGTRSLVASTGMASAFLGDVNGGFPFLGVTKQRSLSGGCATQSSSSSPSLRRRQERLVVRAVGVETEQKGLTRDGILQGGRWLSCTTRHVRLYVGYIDPKTLKMDQTQLDKLSLMLDKDEEFLWTEPAVQKVWAHFRELVDNYAGAELTEYTLRLIGSDLEHFIRKMLLSNEICYNLNCRVLNFSMGKPRYDSIEVESTPSAQE